MNATTDVRKAQVSYRKLAFLSNGLTAAMELEGSIDWFPCPRFDSPSIFSRILDKKRGDIFR
jgi:Glucoamylase and related glycosyl hydrolases